MNLELHKSIYLKYEFPSKKILESIKTLKGIFSKNIGREKHIINDAVFS